MSSFTGPMPSNRTTQSVRLVFGACSLCPTVEMQKTMRRRERAEMDRSSFAQPLLAKIKTLMSNGYTVRRAGPATTRRLCGRRCNPGNCIIGMFRRS
jgi:hypothetical protein